MKLTTILGRSAAVTAAVLAATVLAVTVLAGPADAASDATRTKRARTAIAVTVVPSGTAYYDVTGTLTSRGAPLAGKKVRLQFRAHGRWQGTYVDRTDAAGVVHVYNSSKRAGLRFRLYFPGTKRLKASHSVTFLIDPR